MSTAVNNSRSRITTLPLRAVERASNHKRKLVRVHHIRTVNRLLAGCAAGFLPVASYILAHIESRSEPWLWALVLAALAYSAPTLASWAASWTHKGKAKTALFKAWGFTVLLEGTIVLGRQCGSCKLGLPPRCRMQSQRREINTRTGFILASENPNIAR